MTDAYETTPDVETDGGEDSEPDRRCSEAELTVSDDADLITFSLDSTELVIGEGASITFSDAEIEDIEIQRERAQDVFDSQDSLSYSWSYTDD